MSFDKKIDLTAGVHFNFFQYSLCDVPTIEREGTLLR